MTKTKETCENLNMILSIRHLFLSSIVTFSASAQESFLAKHKRDAIVWQPYSKETLRQAQTKNKPLWVYVGFFGCQWCSVMTKESYQDSALAREIGQHVIPVIVDKYLEPVLDAGWQDWALRHNGATGWPLNLILTPTGIPFAASNYLNPQELVQFVKHASQLWQVRPAEALRRSKQVVNVDRLAGETVTVEDSGYLASGPLFFHLFAIEQRLRSDDLSDSAARLLSGKILENFLRSRLWDVVDGGFHRYATDRLGLAPHFEKLLQDNARLMGLYRRAGVVLGRNEFLATAQLIEEMLEKSFKIKTSVYANAQAAQASAYQLEKKCNTVPGLMELDLRGGGVGIRIESLDWLLQPIVPACWRQWRDSIAIPVDRVALLYPNIILLGAKLDRVLMSGDAAQWARLREEWAAFQKEFRGSKSWRRVWGAGTNDLTADDQGALVWIHARFAAAFGDPGDAAELQRLAQLYRLADASTRAHEPSWRSARELLEEVEPIVSGMGEKIYVIDSEAQRPAIVSRLLTSDPGRWFNLQVLTLSQLKQRNLKKKPVIEKIQP
jgi:hypothetical protein